MEINRYYFLTAAEYLNFTKAAKKHFISQQSFSEQIKRLEEEFSVKLFTRRPRLQLTPAGEIMRHRLLQIRETEQLLKRELTESVNGQRGTLIVGMHATRAKLIMPHVWEIFSAAYPGVQLTVLHEEADILEKKLREGQIDMFLGTNCKPSEDITVLPLLQAPLYVVATQCTWSKVGIKESAPANLTINLHSLTSIPFILSPSNSRLSRTIRHFIDDEGLSVRTPITINDTDNHLLLAAHNAGICFCNALSLPHIEELNKNMPDSQRLRHYRIANLAHIDEIQIVLGKRDRLPSYATGFIQVLQDFLKTIALHISHEKTCEMSMH